jgi:Protein of unknown function (DUF2752)
MRVQPWWWMLPLTAVAVVGIYLLRSYDPNQAGNPFLSCFFHKTTGLYCVGCGITRSLHALVHFDLLRAFRMNALFVVSMPLLALIILRFYRPLPSAIDILIKPLVNPWPWVAVVPLFMLLRNLPWYPFYLLAPISNG